MKDTSATEGGATKPKANKRPLYKVGDYITSEDLVIIRIDAVVDTDPRNPLYAMWDAKTKKLAWSTEHELKTRKLKRIQPQWDHWKSIAIGDSVHCGVTADRRYCSVLAVIGNVVMLSDVPPTRKERDALDKIAEQLEELTDGNITREEVKKKVDMPETSSDAYKTASNRWWTIEELTLMNWELIKGDE